MGIALALTLVASVIGAGVARQAGTDVAIARHDAHAAREIAQAAENRAGLLAEAADRAAQAARVNEHRADSLAALPARVHYVATRAQAPDTCAALVAVADSALAQADSVSSALRSANQSLHTALDSTNTALALVRGSQRQLGVATSNLERAARPSLAARLLPRPGVGLAAGIDAAGRPALVVGVTLGWSL